MQSLTLLYNDGPLCEPLPILFTLSEICDFTLFNWTKIFGNPIWYGRMLFSLRTLNILAQYLGLRNKVDHLGKLLKVLRNKIDRAGTILKGLCSKIDRQ